MKRNGILNLGLNQAIAAMGHGDLMIICDAGFPIPSHVTRIDLAIVPDVPDLEKLYAATAAPITQYETLQDISRYLKDNGTSMTMEELVSQIASPDVKLLMETSVLGAQAPTEQA